MIPFSCSRLLGFCWNRVEIDTNSSSSIAVGEAVSNFLCRRRGQAFELGMVLLTASIAKSLSESGTRHLNADSIPISETLVLRLLDRVSLDISKKVDFFIWCSQNQGPHSGYKHSAAAYSLLFRHLSHPNNRLRLCENQVRDLLGFVKRDGIVLGSAAFELLLDAFIQSGKFLPAIEILDQMERVGASLNHQIYNSVVVALVRKNQLALALSMFTKLLDASAGNGRGSGVAPQSFACNVLLVSLRKAGMKQEFEQVFYKLREKMVVLDNWGYNICIHSFGCWGDLRTSLHLFKEMKDASTTGPDLCTYNTLIRVLCLVGKVKDALSVFEELKVSGHEPDALTYRTIIQGCSKSYRVEDATRVFNEMMLNGFSPDTTLYNSLLDGLLKARKLAEACQLFEKMIQDGFRASCWTHNILIDGLIKNGRAVAGYTLFCNLKKKGQLVDAVTYSIVVLHLCREGQFEESLRLVEEMEARGFVVDLVTITALVIELYKQECWGSIERLVRHIRDSNLLPDVLKWKAEVEAFLENPQGKRKDFTSPFPNGVGMKNFFGTSVDLQPDSSSGSNYVKDPDVDIKPSKLDEWSSSPYLDELADQVETSNHPFPWFSLSRGKRVQGDGMNTFNIDMVNTYLSMFLARGNLSLACKLFEIFTDEGVGAVTYTYNSVASSFVKKGYFDEAWGILHDMSDKLCPADIATYNVIIQNLSKMGRADIAISVLDRLMVDGGYLDVVMYNTLINAVGKAGRVDEALKLFDQMKGSGVNPDIVTFNTLIEVHAKAGKLKDAYRFLRMMLGAGLQPNHVTDTTLDYLGKEIEKSRYQKATMRSNSEDKFL